MKRIYIEGDNAIITYRSDFLLDVQLYNGTRYEGLVAKKLFPITGSNKYISLLDKNEDEVALIRNYDTLMPESKKAVKSFLLQYYFIPKILKITEISEKYGTIKINAETDRGSCYFELRDRTHNLKVLFDGRILIRDTNDNRYEISDIKILDHKSLNVLLL